MNKEIREEEKKFIKTLGADDNIYVADILESIHTLASRLRTVTTAEIFKQYELKTHEELSPESKTVVRNACMTYKKYTSYICTYPRQYSADQIQKILEEED